MLRPISGPGQIMGLRTDLSMRLIKRSFNKRFAMARLTRVPMLGAITGSMFFKATS
jgi:hypothetical protein